MDSLWQSKFSTINSQLEANIMKLTHFKRLYNFYGKVCCCRCWCWWCERLLCNYCKYCGLAPLAELGRTAECAIYIIHCADKTLARPPSPSSASCPPHHHLTSSLFLLLLPTTTQQPAPFLSSCEINIHHW